MAYAVGGFCFSGVPFLNFLITPSQALTSGVPTSYITACLLQLAYQEWQRVRKVSPSFFRTKQEYRCPLHLTSSATFAKQESKCRAEKASSTKATNISFFRFYFQIVSFSFHNRSVSKTPVPVFRPHLKIFFLQDIICLFDLLY